MIYDCFSFFNELDLLELRLNELNPVVDQFVLVESTRTFQKKPKPLYYEENKARFAAFHHKITHIIVDKFPYFWNNWKIPSKWVYDSHQKNQAAKGLIHCKPDDTILFSDLDEIPNPEKLKSHAQQDDICVFQQKHYYYYLNCVEVLPEHPEKYNWWYGTVMTKYKNFESVEKLRLQREINKYTNNTVIEDAGWHFAYLGGVEKIIEKINSYAHSEHNMEDFKNPEKIKQLIESGKSLYGADMHCVFQKIDTTYPKYLVENIEKFKIHIF